MLSGVYVSLRFIHFISLIVAFGCVLYGAWWAPVALRRLMMQRFYPLMRYLLSASALSALLWPDGKLTLPRVEQAVNDAAHFTPYHWVDALLAGKSKRVLHVLQQLRLEGCEPAILLRTLQRELLLLVTLKRQSTHTPLRSLFDKHRVWQNRRQLLSDALARLSGEQLRQAVTLLTRAELTFKQDYGHDVWPELESLSLLLCHKALADVFIDG